MKTMEKENQLLPVIQDESNVAIVCEEPPFELLIDLCFTYKGKKVVFFRFQITMD